MCEFRKSSGTFADCCSVFSNTLRRTEFCVRHKTGDLHLSVLFKLNKLFFDILNT